MCSVNQENLRSLLARDDIAFCSQTFTPTIYPWNFCIPFESTLFGIYIYIYLITFIDSKSSMETKIKT